MTPLSELLAPAGIRLNLEQSQRSEVLRELVEAVPELSGQPEEQEKLFRALLDREQLHSTGIGDGIALPHARNAMVGLVQRPIIVMGRHPQGVSFGSIDGKPTRLFFLLVAPTVTSHLALLARISRLLRQPNLRQGLLTANSPEKVILLFRDAESSLR